MATARIDPYSPCPCGSGKKSKWCCLPLYADLEKAWKQHADGQHEAAIKTLDELVAANPDNPEAYGQKAVMQREMGLDDEADKSLDQAFQLNPNYAFGHYLRGRFREQEGEVAGALLLYRKAAALYDPETHEVLAEIYGAMAEAEMKLNRPVAARAALQIAILHDPANPGYRKVMENVFGSQSTLPESARKEYTFQPLPRDAAPEKKRSWQRALAQQSTGKLEDAVKAFEETTAADPDNSAGWYNLALSRAWLGDNAGALQALDDVVRREPDESAAAEAWALGQVLRCGEGLQASEADLADNSRVYQVRNGQKAGELIQELSRDGRLVVSQVREEEHLLMSIIVEPPPVLVAGGAATGPARYAAQLMFIGGLMRLSSVNAEALTRVARDVEHRLGDAVSEPVEHLGPVHFPDYLSEALVFPRIEREDQQVEARKAISAGVAEFLEETWIHRPLRSLSNIAPVDAAGHEVLRKKLRGVVQFLQEVATAQQLPYDFDRLRRKLGLLQAAPTLATAGAPPDFSSLSTAELARLDLEALSDEALEQAYQAARKLDAQEIATVSLRKLVGRPATAKYSDRFPWYQQLIQQAMRENNLDAALNDVNDGEKADCEHNEGRRRNDYELLRGRVLAKRGELDAAEDVFDRLIARVPAELRYRGTAAEAMLSAKDKPRALRFAQEGLTQARKQQDRDNEQYFLELSAAAGK
jgi:tetratricopeptide (TPR) repeat protein